jgi:hypothetical protein
MKTGDVVCYRNKFFQVGVNMTRTSIELIELKEPAKGWWVSRDEVQKMPHQTQTADQE